MTKPIDAARRLYPAGIVQRDERGRLLPGQRLNPLGKPKSAAAIARDLRETTDWQAVADALRSIAYGTLSAATKTSDRIAAIKLLYDRACGAPLQSVELTGVDDSSARALDLRGASDEDLVELLGRIDRLNGIGDHAPGVEVVRTADVPDDARNASGGGGG